MTAVTNTTRGTGPLATASAMLLALAGCSGGTPSDAPEPPPRAVATSIPTTMLGRWGRDGGCAEPLEVAPDRIGTARIDAVRTAPGDAVDVDTAVEVDGITTGRRYHLAKARGERLAVTVDGRTTTRIRCP